MDTKSVHLEILYELLSNWYGENSWFNSKSKLFDLFISTWTLEVSNFSLYGLNNLFLCWIVDYNLFVPYLMLWLRRPELVLDIELLLTIDNRCASHWSSLTEFYSFSVNTVSVSFQFQFNVFRSCVFNFTQTWWRTASKKVVEMWKKSKFLKPSLKIEIIFPYQFRKPVLWLFQAFSLLLD